MPVTFPKPSKFEGVNVYIPKAVSRLHEADFLNYAALYALYFHHWQKGVNLPPGNPFSIFPPKILH